MTKMLGIQHRFTASYHPSAHGRVERKNQDAERILRREVSHDPSLWPEYLPYVQLAHNIHVDTRSKSEPFALMFGRAPNPFHSYSTMKSVPPVPPEKLKEHWLNLTRNILPAVAEVLHDRQEQMAARWNATHNVIDDIEPGTYVMAVDPTRDSKMAEKFEGPYLVIRKNTGGSYELEDTMGYKQPYLFPPDHLIRVPYYEPTSNDENIHEISNILAHKGTGKDASYLVQWKDKTLPSTWEPVANFASMSLIQKYHKRLKSAVEAAAKGDEEVPYSDLGSQGDQVMVEDERRPPSEQTSALETVEERLPSVAPKQINQSTDGKTLPRQSHGEPTSGAPDQHLPEDQVERFNLRKRKSVNYSESPVKEPPSKKLKPILKNSSAVAKGKPKSTLVEENVMKSDGPLVDDGDGPNGPRQ